MTKVEAFIRPEKLADVQAALSEIGFDSLTVTAAHGAGRHKGILYQFRGTPYLVHWIPRVKLEIAVPDHSVPEVVNTIRIAARTGQIGDGRIFVIPVPEAICISSGEVGNVAVL